MKNVFLIVIALVVPIFFAGLAMSSARNRLTLLRQRLEAVAEQILRLCANQAALVPQSQNRDFPFAGETTHPGTPLSKVAATLVEYGRLEAALAVTAEAKLAEPHLSQWNETRGELNDAVERFNDLVAQYNAARLSPLARPFQRRFPELPSLPS